MLTEVDRCVDWSQQLVSKRIVHVIVGIEDITGSHKQRGKRSERGSEKGGADKEEKRLHGLKGIDTSQQQSAQEERKRHDGQECQPGSQWGKSTAEGFAYEGRDGFEAGGTVAQEVIVLLLVFGSRLEEGV